MNEERKLQIFIMHYMKEVYDLKEQVKTLQRKSEALASDFEWHISYYQSDIPYVSFSVRGGKIRHDNADGLVFTMLVHNIKDASPLDIPVAGNQIAVHFTHSRYAIRDKTSLYSRVVIYYSANDAYMEYGSSSARTELKPSRVREFIVWCINTPEITVHWQ
jgi:hypothetical protein